MSQQLAEEQAPMQVFLGLSSDFLLTATQRGAVGLEARPGEVQDVQYHRPRGS